MHIELSETSVDLYSDETKSVLVGRVMRDHLNKIINHDVRLLYQACDEKCTTILAWRALASAEETGMDREDFEVILSAFGYFKERDETAETRFSLVRDAVTEIIKSRGDRTLILENVNIFRAMNIVADQHADGRPMSDLKVVERAEWIAGQLISIIEAEKFELIPVWAARAALILGGRVHKALATTVKAAQTEMDAADASEGGV